MRVRLGRNVVRKIGDFSHCFWAMHVIHRFQQIAKKMRKVVAINFLISNSTAAQNILNIFTFFTIFLCSLRAVNYSRLMYLLEQTFQEEQMIQSKYHKTESEQIINDPLVSSQLNPPTYSLSLGERSSRGFSNQMMAIYRDSDSSFINVYLPAYLRMKIKSLQGLCIQEMQGVLNLTLILSIYAQGFSQSVRKQIVDKLIIKFKRNSYAEIKQKKDKKENEDKEGNDKNKQQHKIKQKQKDKAVDKDKVKEDEKKEDGMIGASIRKILNTRINPYVFFTPLQILDFILTLKIDPIVVRTLYEGKQVTFRFHINFMNYKLESDNSNIPIAMSFSRQIQFGYYRLAHRRMHVEFTNKNYPKTLDALGKNFYSSQGPFEIIAKRRQKFSRKYQNIEEAKQQQKMHRNRKKLILMKEKLSNKPKSDRNLLLQKKSTQILLSIIELQKMSFISFNSAHFHIPVQKRPTPTFLTVYFPLIILNVLNLSIFFSQPDLPDRLNNIATLLIAFVQMISITRTEIPPNRHLNMIQILAVLSCTSSMLCLLESILLLKKQYVKEQQLETLRQNPIFICIIVLICIPLLAFIISTLYYLYFKRRNTLQFDPNCLDRVNFHLFWNYNSEADQHFYNLHQQSLKKKDENQFFLCQYRYQQFSQKQVYCSIAQSKFQNGDAVLYKQLKGTLAQSKMKQLTKKSAQQFHKSLKQCIRKIGDNQSSQAVIKQVSEHRQNESECDIFQLQNIIQ